MRLAGAQCSSRLRDDTPARRILVLSARCFRRPRNGPLSISKYNTRQQAAYYTWRGGYPGIQSVYGVQQSSVGADESHQSTALSPVAHAEDNREDPRARRTPHRRTRTPVGPRYTTRPGGRSVCFSAARGARALSRAAAHTHIGPAPPRRTRRLNDAQERPHRTSPYRSARSGSVQTWRHTRSVGTVTSESSAAQD